MDCGAEPEEEEILEAFIYDQRREAEQQPGLRTPAEHGVELKLNRSILHIPLYGVYYESLIIDSEIALELFV